MGFSIHSVYGQGEGSLSYTREQSVASLNVPSLQREDAIDSSREESVSEKELSQDVSWVER